jgi:pilus assembly protein Flp/PilA
MQGKATERKESMVAIQARIHGTLSVLRSRLDREEGQALVEYALILALIAVVSIVVLQLMGLNVSRVFGNVNNRLSAVGT